jgi:arginine repressor
MDLKRAINELIARGGYTEQGIADALEAAGVDCTQATINRIKLGKIASTSFEVGTGLMRLHEQIPKGKSRAAERRAAN